jgi:hypothetical protein
MIGSRKSTKKCSSGRVGVKSHKRSSGKTVKSHCRRVGSRKTSKKASKRSSKKASRYAYRKSSKKVKKSYSHKKTAAFDYLPDM